MRYQLVSYDAEECRTARLPLGTQEDVDVLRGRIAGVYLLSVTDFSLFQGYLVEHFVDASSPAFAALWPATARTSYGYLFSLLQSRDGVAALFAPSKPNVGAIVTLACSVYCGTGVRHLPGIAALGELLLARSVTVGPGEIASSLAYLLPHWEHVRPNDVDLIRDLRDVFKATAWAGGEVRLETL